MTKEEGLKLAEELGCLFFECSAKTRENVDRCFEELAQKVLVEAYYLSIDVCSMYTIFLFFLFNFVVGEQIQ